MCSQHTVTVVTHCPYLSRQLSRLGANKDTNKKEPCGCSMHFRELHGAGIDGHNVALMPVDKSCSARSVITLVTIPGALSRPCPTFQVRPRLHLLVLGACPTPRATTSFQSASRKSCDQDRAHPLIGSSWGGADPSATNSP